ncbi:MAG: argininosuccinate lyase [Candidatus Omnitrophota bacterium]
MGKLWGGRFSGENIDPDVLEFTSSLGVDKILAKYDCFSSKTHVEMLAKCGYITEAEKKALLGALEDLKEKIDSGRFQAEGFEDIHSAVQDHVEKRCPDEAKKLHTARSRNEQVVNDVRLYCKEISGELSVLIRTLQKSFVDLAGKNRDVIIPGYTHLNRAQPVLFAHVLIAYVEMLERDIGRIKDAAKRSDISVMGSGAIAGSALKLDRKFVAEKLGFSDVSANSIDSVADRDFMAELLAALSIVAVHLSRISEDLILYGTSEFSFITMGERFTTGSSLMPQKKNPDVLELIRARSANVIGALNSILILLKAQPHAYNRDLQEDKKFLFEAVEVVSGCLRMMAALTPTISVNAGTAREALLDEFIYATDIAEYLVRKGVSFSDAHRIVGNMVGHCASKEINISGLSLVELKGFSEFLEGDVFSLLNSEASVSGKKTEGSTNPELVGNQIDRWKKKLK